MGAVGSANWDVRSFKLNFETQAFIYDRTAAGDMKRLYEEDIEKRCSELTEEMYAERGTVVKMKETLALLFSDLL